MSLDCVGGVVSGASFGSIAVSACFSSCLCWARSSSWQSLRFITKWRCCFSWHSWRPYFFTNLLITTVYNQMDQSVGSQLHISQPTGPLCLDQNPYQNPLTPHCVGLRSRLALQVCDFGPMALGLGRLSWCTCLAGRRAPGSKRPRDVFFFFFFLGLVVKLVLFFNGIFFPKKCKGKVISKGFLKFTLGNWGFWVI